MTIPDAIAREEGWTEENSRCRRNHNPGNMEYGTFTIAQGSTGIEQGKHPRFAVFATDEDGFRALRARLKAPPYKGMTIAEMVAEWAPSSENNVGSYVRNLCNLTGLEPTTIIDNYIDG